MQSLVTLKNKSAGNQKWTKCYQNCIDAYKALEGQFETLHDSFSGYNLVYCGQSKIPSNYLFKKSPIGFITPIHEDISKLCVIRKHQIDI